MANHKSAIKRHRQSLKRRERNRNVKSTIRTSAKEVRALLASGDAKGAAEKVKVTERLLAKAAAKGILPLKTASRQISRLAARVAAKNR